ncbi:MAG: DUF7133 domain-containing protein [Pseudomonadales bacterium]
MLRTSTLLTVLTLTLLLSSCDWLGNNPPSLEEGYEYLFDGATLKGWTKIGGEATFHVDDQNIVGQVGPGENTFLRTQREFGDFILKMEVKFDELGNSGVLFRAQQRDADHEHSGRAYGYQYELDHTERAWSGGIYDEARRGWLYNLEDNAAARAAIRLDDWNEVSIEAIGGSIKTSLNGETAAELADAMDLSGFIGLQVHAGETGIIRWRNIRIKDLGQHEWQTVGLAEVDGWKANNGEIKFNNNNLAVDATDNKATRLTTRRQLGDFAIRFDLPACAQDATINVRAVDTSEGVSIQLTRDQATLTLLGEDDENRGNMELDTALAAKRINVAAVGDTLTASINEQLLGRINGGLPDRGKLIIEITPCKGGQVTLNNIEWLDLKQKPTKKLFYQTLDTPPAPVLSPEEALQSFKLAPGFSIELVAAEPLVAAPVAVTWDEDGRLFVVEMRGFMPDAYGDGQEQPVGQVVMLEDTDADGKMDSSTVFLGELVNPRAVAVVNEGILIGEPPNLWLCKNGSDSDSSSKKTCGNKIRLGDYGEYETEANVEYSENGMLIGLDNWIYNAKSNRRFRIADDKLIEDATVDRGQWGITQDNEGRIFHNNNSVFVNGDMFPAEYVLASALSTGANGINSAVSDRPDGTEEVFSVRVNPGVNRAYLDGTLKKDGRLASPTAVSGLAVYRGAVFPAEYAGDIFVTEPAGNVVAQFRLSEHGLEVRGEHITHPDEQWGQREFLASSDERFRPVDAKVGPDGALYIIDMYRGIIQDQAFLTDELREQIFERNLDKPLDRGRIWRITHKDTPVAREPSNLPQASPQQLIGALSHPNGWRRDTAQRLLATKPSTSVALRRLAASGKGLGASHALWTLQAQRKLDRETVLAALDRGERAVQLQALRAGIDVLEAGDVLTQITRLKTTGDKLRHQLVFNLAPHNDEARVQTALLSILSSETENSYLAEAVTNASRGIEWTFMQQLLGDTRWSETSAARSAVIKQLAANTYSALRGDLSATGPAPALLQQLLTLTQEQSGTGEWRQIAMLEGFKSVSTRDGFVPANLPEAPPLFSDGTIDEANPLWDARLQGRRAFTWPGDELAAGLKPLSANQLAQLEKGKLLYKHCAACHGPNGLGSPGLAPTLVGTSWVLGPPEWLTRIVMQGISGPIEIDGQTWDGVMPGHISMPDFDDDSIAGLLTFVRRSWGNTENPVAAELVAQVRQQTNNRGKPWTAAELKKVPFSRGYEKFAGKYKLSFVKFTVTAEADALHMKVPMYGSGPMQQVDDITFNASTGGQDVKVEFELATDGSVPAMFVYRDGQKMRAERVE